MFTLFFVTAGVILVSGQTTTAATTPANQNQNYRIGPGDLIDVIVSQSLQLTRTGIRVDNQGMIQLAMLDEDIPAGCRTERELAEQIREKYKKFVLEPHVTVAVQQFNSSPVAMIGAVNSPGRFQLQKPMRILDLLAFVNGTAERAGTTIEIIRSRNMPYCNGPQLITNEGAGDDLELITINLADTFKGIEQANPYVRAGDIVRIADAEVRTAYVVGNVKTAMAISLKEPVTLSRAIAMAGGLAPGARSEKIIIRRQQNGSVNKTEIAVNLKEINQQKKDDIFLQPNDIIEVPGPAPNILRDIFKTIIPAAARLPLGVIP